jgi:hypothetical protein
MTTARFRGRCSGSEWRVAEADQLSRRELRRDDGMWCGVDVATCVRLTANSPRGSGSSDGNSVFFLHFGLEIREERVREDAREHVQEAVALRAIRGVVIGTRPNSCA